MAMAVWLVCLPLPLTGLSVLFIVVRAVAARRFIHIYYRMDIRMGNVVFKLATWWDGTGDMVGWWGLF